MDEAKILAKLASENLFLSSNGQNKMCLKNDDDEIIISFPLIPGIDTLTSLKIQLTKLYSVFN